MKDIVNFINESTQLSYPAKLTISAREHDIQNALYIMKKLGKTINATRSGNEKIDGSFNYTIKPESRDELLYLYVGLLASTQYYNRSDGKDVKTGIKSLNNIIFFQKKTKPYVESFTDEEVENLLDEFIKIK